MAEMNYTLLIIILNVNGLNTNQNAIIGRMSE